MLDGVVGVLSWKTEAGVDSFWSGIFLTNGDWLVALDYVSID